jgi:formic-like protein
LKEDNNVDSNSFIRRVLDFLDDENHGLDALIDYLSFRLSMMAQERLQAETSETEEQGNQSNGLKIDHGINESARSNDGFNTMKRTASPNRRVPFIRPGLNDLLDNPASLKRRSRHMARLNMGATDMDIHVRR